jgi:aconitate hydratase
VNLTHRLLSKSLVDGELRAGEEVHLMPDQVLIEDATGSMTYMQFESLGVERVKVPLAVMYVDHNVLQVDELNADEHRFLRSFSSRYGIKISKPGNGISHSIHLERFACPGQVLIGADSHTTTAGAACMFAIGAGGLDVAVALAGHGFWIQCPAVVAVELRGALPDWVEAKDIVLELLRRYGTRGGRDKAFEFVGEGVSRLSVMERATICNMVLETGATTGVFPSDDRTREWLVAQKRGGDFVEVSAHDGAAYDEVEVVDLSSLEPLIAKPHSPGNVVPVAELESTPVGQVCVGSSVNSSYEDLARVAGVLRGTEVRPDIDLTVSPGSRQILDAIARSDVYRDLVAAGARVLEAVCGPCIGVGQAPSAGVPSVRTFNRNFPGRSGTEGDAVYLCSPSVAAVTALRGAITDPRRLGRVPPVSSPTYTPEVVDGHIIEPATDGDAARVVIERGPNIVSPPPSLPVPSDVRGRVLIVLGDDVSTGDMAPDGALGIALWSNIPVCSEFMFRRADGEFHRRALEWGGGVIAAGHNYGQGSSREQAALSASHLGIRTIVAKSFARIHRQNLIAQGILPLVFARDDDHDAAGVGDEWQIDGLRVALAGGAKTVTCLTDSGAEIQLRIDLVPREREILLAGGMLGYLRSATAR